MDIEELYKLRSLINSDTGRLLINFCTDYLTEMASKSGKNAEEIKGMGELIFKIRTIPDYVENLKNRS